MIRIRALVTTACLLALLSSCGADTLVIDANGEVSKGDFARALGACPGEPPDGLPALDVLTMPGVWLRIDGLPVVEIGDDGQAQVEGKPEMVGGDAEAVRVWEGLQEDALALVPSHSDLTKAALDTGAEVYVKMGYEGDIVTSNATVAFLENEFAFVGRCKFEGYTALFRERFGDRASEVARAIIGADSQTTASLLDIPSAPSAAAEEATILNPENTDPSVLAQLELASFNIPDLPESWVGPYTVCTRIDLGWSDCVGLSSPEVAAISVSAYVDPASPTVEAWLLDEQANLLQPIAKLGEVSIPSGSLGELLDDRTAQLSLSLPSDPSVAEAAEYPEKAGEGVVLRG